MRLSKIDPESCRWLEAGDKCHYLGEYISHGNWNSSDTNQQIINLKKRPSTSSDAELRYKRRAVEYWARKLRSSLNLERCIEHVTFIPMPCSKPSDHPDYDTRMVDVLTAIDPQLDVRCILEQSEFRDSQHGGGGRLTPEEIAQSMEVNLTEVRRAPIKRTVFIVDDVITMGASFKAAKNMLSDNRAFRDKKIAGIFLARTVWEDDEDDLDWADAL